MVRPVVAAVPRAKDEPALALQRAVGNRAVAAIVRASRSGGSSRVARDSQAGPGSGRTLARFVGAEHEDLGNTISTLIDLGDGVRFTWGEVVAIAGDEYETVDQLLADARDPKRRFEIRAALENAGVKGPIPSALPAPTAEQTKAHELTYYRLAFDNADHFPDSGRALAAWARHHDRALPRTRSRDRASATIAFS